MAVSCEVLENISVAVNRKIEDVSEQAHRVCKERFNLASSDQVAAVLYGALKLPPPKSGYASQANKRHPSTSEEDLQKIRKLHPVVDLILAHRALSKIASTYISGLKPFLSWQDDRSVPTGTSKSSQRLIDSWLSEATSLGTTQKKRILSPYMAVERTEAIPSARLHANWNQTSVRTGRLSCSNPNLQNIPKEQKIAGLDVNIRTAFVTSASNRSFVASDYSQIEMRILAHMCQDPKMISIFKQEGDIYQNLAANVMKKNACDVTNEERKTAKIVALGIIYGMGSQLAAARLNIDVSAATNITRSFFENFPGIKPWMNRIITYVVTISMYSSVISPQFEFYVQLSTTICILYYLTQYIYTTIHISSGNIYV